MAQTEKSEQLEMAAFDELDFVCLWNSEIYLLAE